MSDELPQTALLSTADPKWSMAELFNREPLELFRKSPEQFERMIAEIRAQAERNKAAEEAGKRIPRAPKLKDNLPVKTDLSAAQLLFGDEE